MRGRDGARGSKVGQPVKFSSKPFVVEAEQLLWSNWTKVCDIIRDLGCEGCYVDSSGKVTEDTNARMGLKVPVSPSKIVTKLTVWVLAVEGDWIVREENGYVYPLSRENFEKRFEAVQ